MGRITIPRLLMAAAGAVTIGGFSTPAIAQAREPRLAVTAVAGREQVSIDAGDGTFTVAGAAVRVRITRYISLLGELTAGRGEVLDRYQGIFTTLAQPGDSLAEIERLGVVLRRDRRWTPGIGGAYALAFHTPTHQRIGLSVSVGLAGREIEVTDTLTLVRLPDEWPASRATGAGGSRYSRSHGGFTVGLAMPVNATSRIVLIPEVRWLRTIADEDFSTTALSVRAGWRF